MNQITRTIDKTFYGGYMDRWDSLRFREQILRHLRPEHHILDLGAGRGLLEEMDFRGHAKFIAGVDLDPVVHENPLLDEARTITPDGRLPFSDASFHRVYSCNVLEHVTDPQFHFSEVFRVLKPGGLFLIKTPNRRHYVALAASMTPHGFHEWYNKLRGMDEEDTFPTVYRCNTPEDMEHFAVMTGFRVSEIELWEGRPEYLRIFPPAYLLGLLFERTVNRFEVLSRFRCVLFSTLVKAA